MELRGEILAMADCCEDKACAIEALQERQSSTLKLVLAINAVMFVVELAAGLLAGSTALLSDSLDNLGDALTYGLSLYAVARGARAKAKVALFKGGLILAAGLFVLAKVAYRMANPTLPVFETMGAVACWRFWPTAPASRCCGSTAPKTSTCPRCGSVRGTISLPIFPSSLRRAAFGSPVRAGPICWSACCWRCCSCGRPHGYCKTRWLS